MEHILNFDNFIGESALSTFSIDELKKIDNIRDRIRYCKKQLGPVLAGGSSRIVFEINDDEILKVAINSKGIAQNRIEKLVSEQNECVVKCFECSDDFGWVIEENCITAEYDDFEEIVGITFYDFRSVLGLKYLLEFAPNHIEMPADDIENAEIILYEMEEENPDNFLSSIIKLMIEYKMSPGDLMKTDSYGLVKRDGKPQIVLIDSGLDFEVFDKYYKKCHKR